MPNRNQGFTLIEMTITLSILVLLISIAVPAVSELIEKNRHQALREALWTALQSARATAVIRRETIDVCGSKSGTSCSSDWTGGWLVRSVSKGRILSATQLPANSELRWKGLGHSVRFLSNGATPMSNGTFYQCNKQRSVWQLKLSRQGRLRLATESENNRDSSLCSN